MTKKKLNGAEYLSKMLQENGVTHLFYQEEALSRVLSNLEKEYKVKPIVGHSELSVGYMADGYARSSGKPAVCYSQSIGAANLAASLHDAWLGNSPVIALTCHKESRLQFRNAYQESNHTAHFSGVTKFNAQPLSSETFPHVIRQCFREVTTGNPRPAHMELEGVGGEVFEITEMTEDFINEAAFTKYPAYRPAADAETVKKAAVKINQAKKPVFVSGRGVFISDDENVMTALAEKANIPVVTTPDGKTTINDDHPLWTGVVGGYGMNCGNQTVADADLVIYIGSQVSDQTTLGFNVPPATTPIIQIDIEGSQIGKNFPNTLGLVGDAKTVMLQLLEQVERVERKDWLEACAALVAETAALQKESEGLHFENGVNTAKLMGEITKSLPDDAIVFSDTGWSAVWATGSIRMKNTQKFIRAAGTLGWSLPASIGGKCANPDKPVVCFCGDGAIFYHLLELETAARYGINTVTILNNNSCYAQVVDCMDEFFSPETEKEKFIKQKEMNTFGPVNFSEIAEQLGAMAIRVEKDEDIAPALEKAFNADRPVLVEVVTDWTSRPLDPRGRRVTCIECCNMNK